LILKNRGNEEEEEDEDEEEEEENEKGQSGLVNLRDGARTSEMVISGE